MASDDDYYENDPLDGYAGKEEPDCPPCGDSGHRGRRRCPDCNPSWWQHQRFVWKWRLRGLVGWWPRRRPAAGALFDEAPF
jgi:hypothetical protein